MFAYACSAQNQTARQTTCLVRRDHSPWLNGIGLVLGGQLGRGFPLKTVRLHQSASSTTGEVKRCFPYDETLLCANMA